MHSPEMFTYGWLFFAAMVAVLLAALFWWRQPIGIALMLAAIAGALVSRNGIPVRHLVEGAFTYYDPMLIIFTAMFFMRVIEENGALGSLARLIVRSFARRPALLLLVVTLFIMFPAALTGISVTSVLTTGALIAPPLVGLGMPPLSVAAFIGLASVMGMVAPPINLIAMIIGQGVDMPYIGFEAPLTLLAFPLALLTAYALGYRHLRRAGSAAAEGAAPEVPGVEPRWTLYIPLLLVFFLMVAIRVLPQLFPDIGVPLIFVIGAVAGLGFGRPVRVVPAAYRALLMALPVLGLLAGIGMFLQVMTLNGVRGLLVVTVLSLPVALIYLGMMLSLPIFGGVSAFASGMVFGIPFLLSLLGRDEIVVCAAISLLAGLGDMLPPSAIVARFAAEAAGVDSFMKVVRKSLPLLVIFAIAALAMIYWARSLAFLTP